MRLKHLVKTYQNQDGAGLVEVMISVLIFLIIVLGGMSYFFLSDANIRQQKRLRLGVNLARNRMETVVSRGYAGISPALNERQTPVLIGGRNVFRTTTIRNIDDPADGKSFHDSDGNIVDYKQITVQIDSLERQIILKTSISPTGK